jgi:hypothetical protein
MASMARREYLCFVGNLWAAGLIASTPVGAAAQLAGRSEMQRRIGDIIHGYEHQGFHRTGTAVDHISGDWLAAHVRDIGLEPAREEFPFSRVDPTNATLEVAGRKIPGLPLFDGGFTTPSGVRGRLGGLDGDAPIGLAESAPNRTEFGPLGDARRQSRHQAIVVVTRGARPGLCPSNADGFLHPFGPPVLQVTSDEAAFLAGCARQGQEAMLTAHVERTPSQAFNVTAAVAGKDRSLAPLVVMTPRSGWWTCASERGGGLAVWLEIMRMMRDSRPARDVWFVASTGHEIGYRGIEVFIERRPAIVRTATAWIHLGANIGAAQGPGNGLQASDNEIESMMASATTGAGLRIDRRVPRDTAPGGEAERVHRGGGRYVSVIGSNDLFHNPMDRGPEAVDLAAIERFAGAFANVVKSLAGV